MELWPNQILVLLLLFFFLLLVLLLVHLLVLLDPLLVLKMCPNSSIGQIIETQS
jgi:hypothetical protein